MSPPAADKLDCEAPTKSPSDGVEEVSSLGEEARKRKRLLEEANRTLKAKGSSVRFEEPASAESGVIASASVVSTDPLVDDEEGECPVSTRPSPRRSTLSVVSKRFDRSGKGYLDETEQALRALDTDNRGEIDMEMAYTIMQQLLTLERSFLNMKRLTIILACFTVVLALSNLGTAFAAFYLARDTSTDSNSILRDVATGDIVKTESACPRIHLTPSRQRRMMLREVNDHEAQDRSLANNHNETGTLYAYYEATREEHQIVSNSMDAGVGCLILVVDRTAMTIYIDKVSSEEQTMSMDAQTSADPNSLFDFTVGRSRSLQSGGNTPPGTMSIGLGGGNNCPPGSNRCRRRSLSGGGEYRILIEETK